MIKSAGLLASVCACVLFAAGLPGCAEEVVSSDDSDDDGEEESSSSATGTRGDAGASKNESSKGDADENAGAEDEGSGESGDPDAEDVDAEDDEPAEGASDADDESPGSSDSDPDDEDEPSGEDGEVVTTDSGTKIYLDPSCESVNPTIAGMALELIGCCTQGGTCGLSNHKLMLPEAFASAYPVQCGDYEMLEAFGAEAPEPKSCTYPD